MTTIIFEISMSLDGYVTAAGVRRADDQVGPLFDWYNNGEAEVTGADPSWSSTRPCLSCVSGAPPAPECPELDDLRVAARLGGEAVTRAESAICDRPGMSENARQLTGAN
jgi:hypothetical protein